MAYLETVDSSVVPHILRARRLESEKRSTGPMSAPQPWSADEIFDDVLASQPADELVPAMKEDKLVTAAISTIDEPKTQADDSRDLLPQIGQAGHTELSAAPPQSPASGVQLDAPEPIHAHPPKPRRFPTLPEWDTGRIWPTARREEPAEHPAERRSNTLSEWAEDTERRLLSLTPLLNTAPRTAAAEEQPAESTPPVVSPRLAIDADSYWEEELGKLISLLEAEAAAATPGTNAEARRDYMRMQVALRMLHLLADRPQLAQQAIPHLDRDEQEFWTALFWALSNYFEKEAATDPQARATEVIAQLRTAAHHLQQQAQLDLRNVNFCRRIESFGNYERFEVDEFVAGDTVLVYCEIRNFQSDPTVDGHYETQLRTSVEIRGGVGLNDVIHSDTFAPTEDRCRSIRTDYFHSYRIDLPPHLSPGSYVLTLKVEDLLGNKVASESIDFTIR